MIEPVVERKDVRWMLEHDGWRDLVSADPGPETLLLVDVPKFFGSDREECLYHWRPDSYILTNETHNGRVGRFFDLSDARRFLVECCGGVVVEEVAP